MVVWVPRLGEVRFQLSGDETRQPNGPAPGARLREAKVQPAFYLGHDLGHGNRAAEQVDATSAQARQLTDAQAAVRTNKH
jgi:hypothetical protein